MDGWWIDNGVCYRSQTTQAAPNYLLWPRRRVWARVTPSVNASRRARRELLIYLLRRSDYGSVPVTSTVSAEQPSRAYSLLKSFSAGYRDMSRDLKSEAVCIL